jgi:threonine dehydratase
MLNNHLPLAKRRAPMILHLVDKNGRSTHADCGASRQDSRSFTMLDAIRSAARAIDPVFRDSPQFVAESLGERLGLRVLCKVETINPIRSFKGRGCDYLLHCLGSAVGPLVSASAGNFGQGLAYAARAREIPVVVFAAETANPLKIERMRALGADVRLVGHDFDATKIVARRWATDAGLRFIEDGREPEIAAGAGTIAVELLRWPEPIEYVLVPVGNGALAAGVGTWFKACSPATKVIGVVAKGAPAMMLSWQAGRLIVTDSAETIADGIAVRMPVPEALGLLADVVDEMVAVEEDELVAAMRTAFVTLGVAFEPAGAAGLAAAFALGDRLARKLVAIPFCGGNILPEQMARWLTA